MTVNPEIFKLLYRFNFKITSVPVYRGMEADNKLIQHELNVMAVWNF